MTVLLVFFLAVAALVVLVVVGAGGMSLCGWGLRAGRALADDSERRGTAPAILAAPSPRAWVSYERRNRLREATLRDLGLLLRSLSRCHFSPLTAASYSERLELFGIPLPTARWRKPWRQFQGGCRRCRRPYGFVNHCFNLNVRKVIARHVAADCYLMAVVVLACRC